MNIAVWIAPGLLAAAYLFVGGTKLLTSKATVFLALAVFIGAARTAEVVR